MIASANFTGSQRPAHQCPREENRQEAPAGAGASHLTVAVPDYDAVTTKSSVDAFRFPSSSVHVGKLPLVTLLPERLLQFGLLTTPDADVNPVHDWIVQPLVPAV